MKTNAEIISDFLQSLRNSTHTIDRMELDYAIEGLDNLIEEHKADIDDANERVESAEYEAESTQSDMQDNINDLEYDLGEMKDTLASVEEALDEAREPIAGEWPAEGENIYADRLKMLIDALREAL